MLDNVNCFVLIKKFIKIVISVLFALPVIVYVIIVIANNSIANNIEKELKSIELPNNTEIVDSISVAGKISGNGNGMQYFGAILVSSELNEDELENYYQNYSKDIHVAKQETPNIFDGSYYQGYKFDDFDSNKKNYMVHRWKYNDSSWNYEDNNFISELLNYDLRGH